MCNKNKSRIRLLCITRGLWSTNTSCSPRSSKTARLLKAVACPMDWPRSKPTFASARFTLHNVQSSQIAVQDTTSCLRVGGLEVVVVFIILDWPAIFHLESQIRSTNYVLSQKYTHRLSHVCCCCCWRTCSHNSLCPHLFTISPM